MFYHSNIFYVLLKLIVAGNHGHGLGEERRGESCNNGEKQQAQRCHDKSSYKDNKTNPLLFLVFLIMADDVGRGSTNLVERRLAHSK
jgi:hypothetical protein